MSEPDLIEELYDALERAVDTLASLRGELEPELTQVTRGRAALAKARASIESQTHSQPKGAGAGQQSR